MKQPTIKDFIGRASYDDSGTMIWGISQNGTYQKILDVRGWGAIQHLFKTEKEAMDFQDSLGAFIAEAINEKLNKINPLI